MKRILTLLFLVFLLFETGTAQVIRYRLSANSGIFLGEPLLKENQYSSGENLSHPGSQNFKPLLEPGIELEIVAPFSYDFEMGIQFEYGRFAGSTPTAPLNNFFMSRYNPLRYQGATFKEFYPDEAMIYDSQILKILGTARWYFLPYSKELNIFMKCFGGVAFTGTDFTFENPVHRVESGVGVLFARGTKNSDYPKMAGITGGTGLGATYRLSDKFDMYFDVTTSLIHSDIVNGIPNFNYITEGGTARMERTSAIAAVMQGSLGIFYSAIPDRRMNKSNITRSSSLNKKNFLKKKSKRSFSKKRRR